MRLGSFSIIMSFASQPFVNGQKDTYLPRIADSDDPIAVWDIENSFGLDSMYNKRSHERLVQSTNTALPQGKIITESVIEGLVTIVVTHDGVIWALDCTGSLLWKHHLQTPLTELQIHSTEALMRGKIVPSLSNGTLILVGSDGSLSLSGDSIRDAVQRSPFKSWKLPGVLIEGKQETHVFTMDALTGILLSDDENCFLTNQKENDVKHAQHSIINTEKPSLGTSIQFGLKKWILRGKDSFTGASLFSSSFAEIVPIKSRNASSFASPLFLESNGHNNPHNSISTTNSNINHNDEKMLSVINQFNDNLHFENKNWPNPLLTSSNSFPRLSLLSRNEIQAQCSTLSPSRAASSITFEGDIVSTFFLQRDESATRDTNEHFIFSLVPTLMSPSQHDLLSRSALILSPFALTSLTTKQQQHDNNNNNNNDNLQQQNSSSSSILVSYSSSPPSPPPIPIINKSLLRQGVMTIPDSFSLPLTSLLPPVSQLSSTTSNSLDAASSALQAASAAVNAAAQATVSVAETLREASKVLNEKERLLQQREANMNGNTKIDNKVFDNTDAYIAGTAVKSDMLQYSTATNKIILIPSDMLNKNQDMKNNYNTNYNNQMQDGSNNYLMDDSDPFELPTVEIILDNNQVIPIPPINNNNNKNIIKTRIHLPITTTLTPDPATIPPISNSLDFASPKDLGRALMKRLVSSITVEQFVILFLILVVASMVRRDILQRKRRRRSSSPAPSTSNLSSSVHSTDKGGNKGVVIRIWDTKIFDSEDYWFVYLKTLTGVMMGVELAHSWLVKPLSKWWVKKVRKVLFASSRGGLETEGGIGGWGGAHAHASDDEAEDKSNLDHNGEFNGTVDDGSSSSSSNSSSMLDALGYEDESAIKENVMITPNADRMRKTMNGKVNHATVSSPFSTNVDSNLRSKSDLIKVTDGCDNQQKVSTPLSVDGSKILPSIVELKEQHMDAPPPLKRPKREQSSSPTSNAHNEDFSPLHILNNDNNNNNNNNPSSIASNIHNNTNINNLTSNIQHGSIFVPPLNIISPLDGAAQNFTPLRNFDNASKSATINRGSVISPDHSPTTSAPPPIFGTASGQQQGPQIAAATASSSMVNNGKTIRVWRRKSRNAGGNNGLRVSTTTTSNNNNNNSNNNATQLTRNSSSRRGAIETDKPFALQMQTLTDSENDDDEFEDEQTEVLSPTDSRLRVVNNPIDSESGGGSRSHSSSHANIWEVPAGGRGTSASRMRFGSVTRKNLMRRPSNATSTSKQSHHTPNSTVQQQPKDQLLSALYSHKNNGSHINVSTVSQDTSRMRTPGRSPPLSGVSAAAAPLSTMPVITPTFNTGHTIRRCMSTSCLDSRASASSQSIGMAAGLPPSWANVLQNSQLINVSSFAPSSGTFDALTIQSIENKNNTFVSDEGQVSGANHLKQTSATSNSFAVRSLPLNPSIPPVAPPLHILPFSHPPSPTAKLESPLPPTETSAENSKSPSAEPSALPQGPSDLLSSLFQSSRRTAPLVANHALGDDLSATPLLASVLESKIEKNELSFRTAIEFSDKLKSSSTAEMPPPLLRSSPRVSQHNVSSFFIPQNPPSGIRQPTPLPPLVPKPTRNENEDHTGFQHELNLNAMHAETTSEPSNHVFDRSDSAPMSHSSNVHHNKVSITSHHHHRHDLTNDFISSTLTTHNHSLYPPPMSLHPLPPLNQSTHSNVVAPLLGGANPNASPSVSAIIPNSKRQETERRTLQNLPSGSPVNQHDLALRAKNAEELPSLLLASVLVGEGDIGTDESVLGDRGLDIRSGSDEGDLHMVPSPVQPTYYLTDDVEGNMDSLLLHDYNKDNMAEGRQQNNVMNTNNYYTMNSDSYTSAFNANNNYPLKNNLEYYNNNNSNQRYDRRNSNFNLNSSTMMMMRHQNNYQSMSNPNYFSSIPRSLIPDCYPLRDVLDNGRLLKTFCDLQPVGAGGFGAVFKARHKLEPGRPEYALKCVLLKLRGNDDLGSRRFFREISAGRDILSKLVVRYYFWWCEEPQFLPFEDLKNECSARAMTPLPQEIRMQYNQDHYPFQNNNNPNNFYRDLPYHPYGHPPYFPREHDGTSFNNQYNSNSFFDPYSPGNLNNTRQNGSHPNQSIPRNPKPHVNNYNHLYNNIYNNDPSDSGNYIQHEPYNSSHFNNHAPAHHHNIFHNVNPSFHATARNLPYNNPFFANQLELYRNKNKNNPSVGRKSNRQHQILRMLTLARHTKTPPTNTTAASFFADLDANEDVDMESRIHNVDDANHQNLTLPKRKKRRITEFPAFEASSGGVAVVEILPSNSDTDTNKQSSIVQDENCGLISLSFSAMDGIETGKVTIEEVEDSSDECFKRRETTMDNNKPNNGLKCNSTKNQVTAVDYNDSDENEVEVISNHIVDEIEHIDFNFNDDEGDLSVLHRDHAVFIKGDSPHISVNSLITDGLKSRSSTKISNINENTMHDNVDSDVDLDADDADGEQTELDISLRGSFHKNKSTNSTVVDNDSRIMTGQSYENPTLKLRGRAATMATPLNNNSNNIYASSFDMNVPSVRGNRGISAGPSVERKVSSVKRELIQIGSDEGAASDSGLMSRCNSSSVIFACRSRPKQQPIINMKNRKGSIIGKNLMEDLIKTQLQEDTNGGHRSNSSSSSLHSSLSASSSVRKVNKSSPSSSSSSSSSSARQSSTRSPISSSSSISTSSSSSSIANSPHKQSWPSPQTNNTIPPPVLNFHQHNNANYLQPQPSIPAQTSKRQRSRYLDRLRRAKESFRAFNSFDPSSAANPDNDAVEKSPLNGESGMLNAGFHNSSIDGWAYDPRLHVSSSAVHSKGLEDMFGGYFEGLRVGDDESKEKNEEKGKTRRSKRHRREPKVKDRKRRSSNSEIQFNGISNGGHISEDDFIRFEHNDDENEDKQADSDYTIQQHKRKHKRKTERDSNKQGNDECTVEDDESETEERRKRRRKRHRKSLEKRSKQDNTSDEDFICFENADDEDTSIVARKNDEGWSRKKPQPDLDSDIHKKKKNSKKRNKKDDSRDVEATESRKNNKINKKENTERDSAADRINEIEILSPPPQIDVYKQSSFESEFINPKDNKIRSIDFLSPPSSSVSLHHRDANPTFDNITEIIKDIPPPLEGPLSSLPHLSPPTPPSALASPLPPASQSSSNAVPSFPLFLAHSGWVPPLPVSHHSTVWKAREPYDYQLWGNGSNGGLNSSNHINNSDVHSPRFDSSFSHSLTSCHATPPQWSTNSLVGKPPLGSIESTPQVIHRVSSVGCTSFTNNNNNNGASLNSQKGIDSFRPPTALNSILTPSPQLVKRNNERLDSFSRKKAVSPLHEENAFIRLQTIEGSSSDEGGVLVTEMQPEDVLGTSTKSNSNDESRSSSPSQKDDLIEVINETKDAITSEKKNKEEEMEISKVSVSSLNISSPSLPANPLNKKLESDLSKLNASNIVSNSTKKSIPETSLPNQIANKRRIPTAATTTATSDSITTTTPTTANQTTTNRASDWMVTAVSRGALRMSHPGTDTTMKVYDKFSAQGWNPQSKPNYDTEYNKDELNKQTGWKRDHPGPRINTNRDENIHNYANNGEQKGIFDNKMESNPFMDENYNKINNHHQKHNMPHLANPNMFNNNNNNNNQVFNVVLFIQMELCPGVTLRQWLDSSSRSSLPLQWTRGRKSSRLEAVFMRQIIKGIRDIHKRNVVHRDLKPENIFVNIEKETLKIGDFGLARFVDTNNSNNSEEKSSQRRDEGENNESNIGSHHLAHSNSFDHSNIPIRGGFARTESQISISGQIIGTPGYVAPEGGALCSEKADIYSAALIFLELLSPRADTVMEKFKALSDFRNRSKLPSFITTSLPLHAELLMQMARRTPSDRPSASEVARTLKRIQSELVKN